MQGLVTTAPSGDLAEADALAARCGLSACARGGRSVEALAAQAGGAPVLVLGAAKATLHAGGRAYVAGPGLALLRLARMRRGEVDPLVHAAGLRAGDLVLDATLGLGGDALVAAQATGAAVVALEASCVLAAFTLAGLRRLRGADGEAAARIDVRRADYRALLPALPSRSFDVVLFDPMFRRAAAPAAGQSLGPLRDHAEHAPLRAEDLREARRVARRGVLVKDGWDAHELHRLRLDVLPARRSARFQLGWADAM